MNSLAGIIAANREADRLHEAAKKVAAKAAKEARDAEKGASTSRQTPARAKCGRLVGIS